ncbi:hypothetical protein HPP92_026221 [Vanilla planifolia]|uniref:Uncharacterized protein n=1 Tax=Vanilla planifolia TaxID=51239 RepID=A0A835PF64_VANPL|nr:hypothetical protein HPP92_026401 [Vanilla planifolia]KAG0451528.1 hypothetical protein HPP92_026221 [Vanilla planifolia]
MERGKPTEDVVSNEAACRITRQCLRQAAEMFPEVGAVVLMLTRPPFWAEIAMSRGSRDNMLLWGAEEAGRLMVERG